MSGDFPAVSTLSSAVPAGRRGWLHELRYFVGAALAGSVICGLAVGWAGHRELVQGIGALMGLFMYASVRRHLKDE